MNFSDLAKKKIAGVPVLYLAAAAVTVLLVLAWRMKSTPDPEVTDVGNTDDLADAANALENPYDGLSGSGTVIVQQTPVDADATPEDPKTNETWVRDGAEWLVSKNMASGTVAFGALNKYVTGADRSYDEDSLVNAVIKEKGMPPESIAEGGGVGAKPLTRQFTTLPGVHKTIGGENYTQIATLYYGQGSIENRDLLQGANTQYGLSEGPFPTGTAINVPKYHSPRYYVTPKAGMTKSQVAAANGISFDVLRAYNNGPKYESMTTFPKGYRLKVA